MSRCPYHQGCSSELDCPWIIPVVCPPTPNFLVRVVEWLARFDHLGPFPSSVTGPVLLVPIPASLRAFCPLTCESSDTSAMRYVHCLARAEPSLAVGCYGLLQCCGHVFVQDNVYPGNIGMFFTYLVQL